MVQLNLYELGYLENKNSFLGVAAGLISLIGHKEKKNETEYVLDPFGTDMLCMRFD